MLLTVGGNRSESTDGVGRGAGGCYVVSKLESLAFK